MGDRRCGPSPDEAERAWTALWKPIPTVVFSPIPWQVRGNVRPAAGGVAEEFARLWDETGESGIALGGAPLAAEAASWELIDEYQVMVRPVFVGGGAPNFAREQCRVELERVEARPFDSGIIFLRYHVGRWARSRSGRNQADGFHGVPQLVMRVAALAGRSTLHRSGALGCCRERTGWLRRRRSQP